MFKVSFKITNDAFQNGGGREESARILEKIANDLRDGMNDGNIKDINGNHVGTWEVKK